MPTDSTTFFLAFAALFGAILVYLWRLERLGRRLEKRLLAVATKPLNDDPPGTS